MTMLGLFKQLANQIAITSLPHFSGMGLVFYDEYYNISNYHCDLVHNTLPLAFLTLHSNHLFTYLQSISTYDHPCHDGFHFINQKGVLTHIAQFFSPPIDKTIKNIVGHGSRVYCAKSGMNIPGVIAVAAISSNRSVYIFEKKSQQKIITSHNYYQCSNLSVTANC